jgi:hypothetical protein
MLYEKQEAFSKELDLKLQNHSETLKKGPTQAGHIQSIPHSHICTPSIIHEEPVKKIQTR